MIFSRIGLTSMVMLGEGFNTSAGRHAISACLCAIVVVLARNDSHQLWHLNSGNCHSSQALQLEKWQWLRSGQISTPSQLFICFLMEYGNKLTIACHYFTQGLLLTQRLSPYTPCHNPTIGGTVQPSFKNWEIPPTKNVRNHHLHPPPSK